MSSWDCVNAVRRWSGVRGLFWLGLSLGLLGAAIAARVPLRVQRAPRHMPQGRERTQGQWIWTARDRALFEETQAQFPSLRASILIGTIECASESLHTKRGLSPLTAGSAPQALVVRLSDSVHGCFEHLSDAVLDRLLDDELSRLLGEVRDTGANFHELELDYDAPVSKLDRYATALRYLRAHALRGLDLWITSLPVHVLQENYGRLLDGAVSGHILQLFDTGLVCDEARAAELRAALQARALPYRIGYGTFERKDAPSVRSHWCWIGLTRAWQHDPGASGWWIFPAGIGYRQSAELLFEESQ